MLFKQNLSLQGEFSYKVYSENGILKQEASGIKNFITSTGLTYPSTYAFADCFRFITLGSGNDNNTIIGAFGGTTGLTQPIKAFSYIGSRTDFNDPATTAYESPSCGYLESSGQVQLSRGWKIPNGYNTFSGDYTFYELMLSPGKPTGAAGLCGCQGSDTSNGGVDASIIADYYDTISNASICKARSAFTRIILDPPITVNDRDFLVVNYSLNVGFDTGINIFTKNISNTFSSNWGGAITGTTSLIHHGIKLINNGDSTNHAGFRNQIHPNSETYTWASEYGESFVPLWGAPLEPSCLSTNLLAYLSTDNVQFLANQISGGAFDHTLWEPYTFGGYPQSSGLLISVPNPSNTNNPRLFNIRTNLTGPIYPNQTGAEAIGTPLSDINYIFHSSYSKSNLNLSHIVSDRYGSILHSCVFTNLNSFNWANGTSPTPLVRSMVLNYKDITSVSNNIMYPFLDVLFTGNMGEGLCDLNPSDYSYSSPSSDYFFLGGGGDLTLSFTLTWSSPCPFGVDGC